jgi:hypothetical protein
MNRLDPVSQIPNIWAGWCTVGDFLLDDDGNHYSKWEILALPYVYALNIELRKQLALIKPKRPPEPQQLELPFPPMWKHQYDWLHQRKDQKLRLR